jgi:hypothetical protein
MDLGFPEIEFDGTGNVQLPDSQGSFAISAARWSRSGRSTTPYFPAPSAIRVLGSTLSFRLVLVLRPDDAHDVS